MKKHHCPAESPPATNPRDADAWDAFDEADVERQAALAGHDALVAQAEGELAAVLRSKVARSR